MNKKYELLNIIGSDLKIQSFNAEEEGKYIARVIYSALGMWIRTVTLDKVILDEHSDNVGVSKIYINNRCEKFANNMLEVFPEIREWFYPEGSNENLISIIRERLYMGQELVDIGFETNMALPKYEECDIGNGVKLIRGVKKGEFKRIFGLTQIEQVKNTKVDFNRIINFYNLECNCSETVLNEYLSDCKWESKSEFTGQIFDKYSKKSFSNCWSYEYEIKNKDITLYKYGINDFGFIKKIENQFYIHQINKYLIDKYEISRFMYGLKSKVNNKPIVKYKKYGDSKLIKLKLFNRLPKREENVLMIIGWPVKNINDKFNILIQDSTWPFIRSMLENLNINLEEDLNG